MIEVSNLGFSYRQHPVFEQVSFSLGKGRLCALLGVNGSGKTTLFKCCLQLLPVRTGHIRLADQDIAGLPVAAMARLAAYVPQDHQPAFPFKVKDVVLMGRTPQLSGRFHIAPVHYEQCIRAMDMLGLLPLAEKPLTALSGGQRQLVMIARALAQETPVLLLDEPTAALDFRHQLMIWDILQQIARDGATLMVCTHDPNHVLWFCDQVLVLHEGRLLADGVPGEVLDNQLLETLYGPYGRLVQVGGRPTILPNWRGATYS
jgi:iron complex transport system ATP-binding protein